MKGRKRRWFLAVGLCALALLLAAPCLLALEYFGCFRREVKRFVCEEDYPALYADELQRIFGDDCEIGPKRDAFTEGEDCSCGFHSDSYDYDTWEIACADAEGRRFTQELNNRDDFAEQELRWLTEQLEQYYRQVYIERFFPEAVRGEFTTYAYVRLAAVVSGFSLDGAYPKERFDEAQNAQSRYLADLQAGLSEEGRCIPLSKLDYAGVFTAYPMEVLFNIRLNDEALSDGEREQLFQNAERSRRLLADALCADTNGMANFSVDTGPGEPYTVLAGKRFESKEVFDYEYALYDSFCGKFW